MKNNTRQKLNAYANKVASLNGVESATVKFNVAPSVQQTLETKIQESSEFLSKINIVGVDEKEGQKLGLGISGPIAGNTDTSNKDRTTSDGHDLTHNNYNCRKNNSDSHIGYATLDMWAKFPDFQAKLRDAIIKRQALDRIMIGFNGTSYAADSNKATNPLLQDVNIGWFQQYRTHAAARVMSEVVESSNTIKVYEGGDYENLDALVADAVNNLIDPWHQEDTALVAIMGRDLLADKYFPLINQTQPATEKIATDLIVSQKRVGGLPAVRAPFVPAGCLMITTLDNLSIYFQESARRRHIKDKPERDRIENYESSNDAYVIEDYGRGCLVENIDTQKPA